MENQNHRDRIDSKACLYTLYSPRTTTYLLQAKYELSIKTKKRISNKKKKECSVEKKIKREFSSRDRKGTTFTGTPLDDVQCTATKSPAPSTLSVGIKPTLGGNNQSEYTLNDHTPHSLSIQAETQARSQDLRHRDNHCRSLPQRGAQHLRQPSSTLSEGRTMHDILLAPEPHAGRLPIGWTTQ